MKKVTNATKDKILNFLAGICYWGIVTNTNKLLTQCEICGLLSKDEFAEFYKKLSDKERAEFLANEMLKEEKNEHL